ncbi:MAG: MBL fold metallo-hydrolase [Desulfobacteraceae bacterium]|nr:MBL fold metallo-hydrolase [Desulfobacteraceae bacterium]
MQIAIWSLTILSMFLFPVFGKAAQFETDVIETSAGTVEIMFLGHSSLKMEFNDRQIYIDPVGESVDYTTLPKADIILITHEHKDHFDLNAIRVLAGEKALVVMPESCAAQYQEGIVMRNEDVKIVQGLKIEGVPAYNIVHKRKSGFPYHLKGIGNGYIITLGDRRIYVAGDTENIPEMKELSEIDVAFLPVNLPYTMTVEMAADAVRTIRPKIFYPYHTGDTDLSELVELLKNQSDTDVRIRNMK